MPAGELIPRPGNHLIHFCPLLPLSNTTHIETASPPIITAPVTFNPRNADRAILFMIDQDVPRNNSRVTLLHWFIPNILVAGASNGTLRIPTTGGAPYLQPSPPVGDIPHRYVFLLFRQPDNFSIPAGFNISPPASTADRIGFNITDFVAKAGLSAPAAANWITVQNLTGVASATASGGASATRTAGVTTGTASILPYTGGAGNVGYGSLSGLVSTLR